MHPHDTRTVIIETAAGLFADLGYSAVSMRDVASKVGVTPANLYHHFKGKDELIREALAHVRARQLRWKLC
ncbi:helix-turn-helix transcriptional regulator [Ochrobactrum grignonense]|nr:helix-turn-helix transcriptional regulator [Brucella grignonensis]